MPKKRLKEKDVLKACEKLLSSYGFRVIRVNSGMTKIQGPRGNRYIRMAAPGTSDLIACSPDGKFFAIEIKAPGKKPSEVQLKFLKKISDRRGIAMWTDSAEDLENRIKILGYEHRKI